MGISTFAPALLPLLAILLSVPISAEEYCNMTSCSEHHFNYTYDDSADILTCECFPGYSGRCCEDLTDCAYGTFNNATGKCDCFNTHYSGDRCDIIACENDGKFVSEERRSSRLATGCTCVTGVTGDFCEKVGMFLQGAARVRITTTSRTSSRGWGSSRGSSSGSWGWGGSSSGSSWWRRSISSPYYHNTYAYGTYGSRGQGSGSGNFNPHWLWSLLIVFVIIVIVWVCCSNGCCDNNTETITKTVVELDMTDAEAQDLVDHPEKAAFYTAKYHHPPPGNTTTTTQVEVWRD